METSTTGIAIDWNGLKSGSNVIVGDCLLPVFVSKGRKMAMFFDENGRDIVTKKVRRGAVSGWVRIFYAVTIYTDFGAVITTDCSACCPSESYTMPDGSKTSNKWEIYEFHLKKSVAVA